MATRDATTGMAHLTVVPENFDRSDDGDETVERAAAGPDERVDDVRDVADDGRE